MNTRLRRNTFRFICASALTALLVACGDPGAERKTFVFTPAAYTPIPENERCDLPFCGAGIAFTEEGGRYFADHVLLTIDKSSETKILETLDEYGFDVVDRSHVPRPNETLDLLVRVPLGAVPAAIEFLAELEGMREARPNFLLTGLEESRSSAQRELIWPHH